MYCQLEGHFHTQVEPGNALNLKFLFPVDSYADWTNCYTVVTKNYTHRADVSVTVSTAAWVDKTSGGKRYKRIGFRNIPTKELQTLLALACTK